MTQPRWMNTNHTCVAPLHTEWSYACFIWKAALTWEHKREKYDLHQTTIIKYKFWKVSPIYRTYTETPILRHTPVLSLCFIVMPMNCMADTHNCHIKMKITKSECQFLLPPWNLNLEYFPQFKWLTLNNSYFVYILTASPISLLCRL